MQNERNMHTCISFEAYTAIRRNRAIRRVKHAVVLDDYRTVFPQDRDLFFVYKVKEGASFLLPYQISILNLFIMDRMDVLAMR